MLYVCIKWAIVCTVAKLNDCGRWMERVVELGFRKSSEVVDLKWWR